MLDSVEVGSKGEPWGQCQQSPPSETAPFIVSPHSPPTFPSESLGPHSPGPAETFKDRAKDNLGPSPGPLSTPREVVSEVLN